MDRVMVELTLIVILGMVTLALLRPTERQHVYAVRQTWRRRPGRRQAS